MDESYSSGPPITAIVVAVVAVLILIAVASVALSSDATDRTQAQSQAQIAAERERTERMIAEQQTQRHSADLRAENSARIAMTMTYVLAMFGIFGAFGLVVWANNWSADRHVERQLLILQAQRQAAQLPQPPQPLTLTARRNKERVWRA